MCIAETQMCVNLRDLIRLFFLHQCPATFAQSKRERYAAQDIKLLVRFYVGMFLHPQFIECALHISSHPHMVCAHKDTDCIKKIASKHSRIFFCQEKMKPVREEGKHTHSKLNAHTKLPLCNLRELQFVGGGMVS